MSFAGSGMNDGLEQASQPSLCVNNCGFFANVGTAGMCSKCFREVQSQEEKSKVEAKAASDMLTATATADVAATTPAPAPSAVMLATPCVEAAASSIPTPAAEAASPAEPCSKGPSRCFSCRKKVGLTGFKCKCGHLFCGQHRYAEAHECSFDYKTAERAKLAENNPLVQAAKVEKI